jgi:nucleoid-associated protein YgaU
VKASLIPAKGPELKFRFNPREYSISKSADWTRPTSKGAKPAAKPEFQGTKPRVVSMELMFDDWEGKGGLVQDIETLLNWMTPSKDSLSHNQPEPMVLQFQWGAQQPLARFKGFLKSVNAKFTLFKPDGTPIRAMANIQMEEIPQDPPGTNPTSGSLAARRSHVVVNGESLHSVAFAEYGNPGLWRGLAAFNEIDDPLRVYPGTSLLLPTAEEAAALS